MNIAIRIVVLVCASAIAVACSDDTVPESTNTVLVAPVRSTAAAQGLISETKVDAAVQFLAPHIPSSFVHMIQRDSLAEVLRADGDDASVLAIAQKAHASRLLFFSFDRIENLLRADAKLVYANKPDSAIEASGFGVLRYRDKNTGQFVADPTILQAVANSLAALPDSSISAGQTSQPVVVCGGFSFVANERTQNAEIFTKKILNSYSAVVEATKSMSNVGRLVVVDVDTRDSMLAKQGYYMLENYTGASNVEIQELRKYGVGYYVSGEVKATLEGIEVRVDLYNIREATNLVATESLLVESDEWETIQSALVHLTERICKDETSWK